MKKLLIASAALAMVAGTAQAQSSVEVYGLLDMGYNATKYENNNNVAGANGKTSTMGALSALSSSRLGFRGTEDLGGGTKAIFTLELGFQSQDVNAGTAAASTAYTADVAASGSTAATAATVGARDSSTNLDTNADKARIFTLGLTDAKLGTVRIGRDKAPAQLAVEKYTAGGANNSVGEFFLYGTSAANFGGGANAADFDVSNENFGERVSGGLFYTTPNFNGLTVNAVVADDKNSDQDGAATVNRQAKHTGVSVAYEGIKNLSITYAMHERKVRALDATTYAKDEFQTIGASYTLGNAKLFGQWVDAEKKSAAGAQTAAHDGYQIGVGYTMGKNYLWAQMGDAESEGATAGTKAYDRKGYQLGARYDMSKRTSLYAIYGEQEAKSVTAGAAIDYTTARVGVTHSF